MRTDESKRVSYVLAGLLTPLWLAAIVQAWRMPDTAFASQRSEQSSSS